jgi:hypothetical protein
MSIELLLRALRLTAGECREYYNADDDIETHLAYLRRARQVDKLESKILRKYNGLHSAWENLSKLPQERCDW